MRKTKWIGIQFGKYASFVFFPWILSIGFMAASIVYKEYLFLLGFAVLSLSLLSWILNIHGIDIHLKKNRIRPFTLWPWGKVGKWVTLTGKEYVAFSIDRFSVTVPDLADVDPTTNHFIENHRNFLVLLKGNPKGDFILGYSENPNRAMKMAKSWRSELRIETEVKKIF